MDFLTQIQEYRPCCEQETIDRERILSLAKWFSEMILTRDCELAHITGSGMIFNPKRDHVLMVYHNLYKSWSWTGGHADGEPDQLSVALREAKEETGVHGIRALDTGIAALDLLSVPGHYRHGQYVSAHLHLSVSYLLEADDSQPLTVRPEENSGVQWIPIDRLEEFCSEPEMLPIYQKLIRKAVEL